MPVFEETGSKSSIGPSLRRESGSVQVMEVGHTSALPTPYHRAHERLLSLDRPSGEAKQYAWRWLLKWRRILNEKHGAVLPAPHIFANEHRVIEFEWENADRFLMLRLIPNGPFGYHKSEDASSLDEEGQIDIAGVCSVLHWYVTGSDATAGQ